MYYDQLLALYKNLRDLYVHVLRQENMELADYPNKLSSNDECLVITVMYYNFHAGNMQMEMVRVTCGEKITALNGRSAAC